MTNDFQQNNNNNNNSNNKKKNILKKMFAKKTTSDDTALCKIVYWSLEYEYPFAERVLGEVYISVRARALQLGLDILPAYSVGN